MLHSLLDFLYYYENTEKGTPAEPIPSISFSLGTSQEPQPCTELRQSEKDCGPTPEACPTQALKFSFKFSAYSI